MLRISICASAALALVASAAPARAQLRGPQLPALAVANGKLEPGAWVRYSVVNTGASQALMVYIAALERKGKAQWFEMAITGGRRRTLVMRTLVKGLSAKKPGKLEVLEAIVQPPGQRPLRLPAEVAAKQKAPVAPAARPKGAGKIRRGVKVSVPAGTFTTTHYQRKVGGREENTWMSSSLGAWPLVRYQLGTLFIELAARGKDASSRIRGKPIKIDKRLLEQLGGAP